MKQMLFSGGLLAGDLLAKATDMFACWEVHEIHYEVLAPGLMGLLLLVLQFSQAASVAVIEHGERFTIEKKGFRE